MKNFRARGGVRVLTFTSVLFLQATGLAAAQQTETFQFALIGDMPYTKLQAEEFPRVLDVLKRTDLAFVVHIGDMQDDPRGYYTDPSLSTLPCTDQNYQTMLDAFQNMPQPVIVTPGDNDWTDCHLVREPKFDV